jgi:arsenate reductase
MKLYHNNRCSKSRCAFDWLQENNFDFELVEYLKTPPTKAELKAILTQLGKQPSELVRKSEEEYSLYIKDKQLREEEILDLMLQFPKLIERPIVVWDNNAVVARPLELLIEKLK